MSDFVLDTDTLAGESYQVLPFDMDGEFRDIQLHFSQGGANQDMELHFLEIHYTIGGVSKETL